MMRILIVDDSSYARQRIGRILAEAGHEIVEAENGAEALKLFPETNPDVITVDLLMPGMDGLEVIRRLRSAHPRACIVAVSADVQEATVKEVMATGANAFVSKTEDPNRLKDIIEEACGLGLNRILSMVQQDAFTEMMNITMGQAAQALSRLLERRVLLKVPKIEIMDSARLCSFLDTEVRNVGAVIHQRFSGVLNGVACLLFPEHHAVTLVRALLDAPRELSRLTASEQTVLAEVGNVVLNAAIARLGNQLHTRLKVEMPMVGLNQTSPAAASLLLNPQTNTEHAIVLLSRLTISEVDMLAYLILMLSAQDMRCLIEAIEV